MSTSTQIAHAFMQPYQQHVVPLRSHHRTKSHLERPFQKRKTYIFMVQQAEVSNMSMINTSLISRIENLLSDDHDEEDEDVPDYSEEAAKEVADKSIYSRISDNAKWKANMAIKKRPNISMEPIDINYNNSMSSKRKRIYKSKMTASVKETGVETISDYVKSMGQHELLPHESEILLARQIQILVQWESKRQELEDSLSR